MVLPPSNMSARSITPVPAESAAGSLAQYRLTPDAEFVLVTASDARLLRRLCESAATAIGNFPDCITDALVAWH